MTPKKLKLAGGKQSRNTANAGDAQAALAVTPAIADAAAEIQSLIASQTRSGKVDVGSDFQMRLARAREPRIGSSRNSNELACRRLPHESPGRTEPNSLRPI